MRLGLIGRKLGVTRIYDAEGLVIPVTVVELGPNKVVRKRTQEAHGYSAVQLGFGSKRKSLFNKPELGAFEKLGLEPVQVLRELRLPADELGSLEVGQDLTCELFSEGQKVDVQGVSKGKGFAGVIKRHHMAGFPMTHGTHEYHRHGGSIGMRAQPGRVLPGKRMAGQMGNEIVTTQNVLVVKVLKDENIVMLRGSVPGANHGLVRVTPAVKVRTKREQ
ncbi:MAG: 50S ribosomal protein L3 [Pseudomonadota bacterium]